MYFRGYGLDAQAQAQALALWEAQQWEALDQFLAPYRAAEAPAPCTPRAGGPGQPAPALGDDPLAQTIRGVVERLKPVCSTRTPKCNSNYPPPGVDGGLTTPIPGWDVTPGGTTSSPVTPVTVAFSANAVQDAILPDLEATYPAAPRAIWATYRLLHRVALEVCAARRYTRTPHVAVFHAPAQLVAWALGVHRTTLWRHLAVLEELGLVQARAHKTAVSSLPTPIANTGTLFAVALRPDRRARLRYEDFRHPWRDLDADVRAGATSYDLTLQEVPLEVRERVLTAWACGDRITDLEHAQQWQPHGHIAAIYDLQHARSGQRAPMVDAVARSLAHQLRDTGSINLYRRLLWGLLRRWDTGENWFPQVYSLLERVLADTREGWARRPGALLMSRLHQTGLAAHLLDAPSGQRVA